MMRVLIDTGIFVNFLNDEPKAEFSGKFLEQIQNKKIEGLISTITIAEFFSLYYKISERRTIRAKTYIESIIEGENIIPTFKSITELAGKIKSGYKVSLGDSIIIATAILTGCDYLISLDPEIKKIDLIEVKEPKELL
jgi:predicted nucleic acid-binding protein